MERMFYFSADRTNRTVLRTLAAALTELRIDHIFTHSLTDFCGTFMLVDMFQIFVSE